MELEQHRERAEGSMVESSFRDGEDESKGPCDSCPEVTGHRSQAGDVGGPEAQQHGHFKEKLQGWFMF